MPNVCYHLRWGGAYRSTNALCDTNRNNACIGSVLPGRLPYQRASRLPFPSQSPIPSPAHAKSCSLPFLFPLLLHAAPVFTATLARVSGVSLGRSVIRAGRSRQAAPGTERPILSRSRLTRSPFGPRAFPLLLFCSSFSSVSSPCWQRTEEAHIHFVFRCDRCF